MNARSQTLPPSLQNPLQRPNLPQHTGHRDAGYGASVLYVEDFDDVPAPRSAPEDAPEIIAPGYTAEDVETAREEGRAAGLEEARAEDATLHAALSNAALAAIGDALTAARGDAAIVAARAADGLSAAVLGLLTAALPVTAARLAPAEIAGLLDVLLPPLSRAPGVTLRVHPDVLPSIAKRLTGFADLTASADPTLAPSDVHLAWRDGEARRDWDALWLGLCRTLAPFGLPADLAPLVRDMHAWSAGPEGADHQTGKGHEPDGR